MKLVCTFAAVSLLWTANGCKKGCIEQPASAVVELAAPKDRTVSDWEALDRIAATKIETVGSLSRDGRQSVRLPLNLNADQTRYAFLIDGKPDTLTIRYGTQTRFVSQECGYVVNITRPLQGIAVRRALIPVDSVFYYGDRPAWSPRFFAPKGAMLIKLNL